MFRAGPTTSGCLRAMSSWVFNIFRDLDSSFLGLLFQCLVIFLMISLPLYLIRISPVSTCVLLLLVLLSCSSQIIWLCLLCTLHWFRNEFLCSYLTRSLGRFPRKWHRSKTVRFFSLCFIFWISSHKQLQWKSHFMWTMLFPLHEFWNSSSASVSCLIYCPFPLQQLDWVNSEFGTWMMK